MNQHVCQSYLFQTEEAHRGANREDGTTAGNPNGNTGTRASTPVIKTEIRHAEQPPYPKRGTRHGYKANLLVPFFPKPLGHPPAVLLRALYCPLLQSIPNQAAPQGGRTLSARKRPTQPDACFPSNFCGSSILCKQDSFHVLIATWADFLKNTR